MHLLCGVWGAKEQGASHGSRDRRAAGGARASMTEAGGLPGVHSIVQQVVTPFAVNVSRDGCLQAVRSESEQIRTES